MVKTIRMILLLPLLLPLLLSACVVSKNDKPKTAAAANLVEPSSGDEADVPQPLTAYTGIGKKTLVAYFPENQAVCRIAENIAAITSGDLYEITSEPSDNEPKLPSLESYGVVYLGYPLIQEQPPQAVSAFVKNCRFGMRAVIPFCIGNSESVRESAAMLAQLSKSGNWLSGASFSEDASEKEIRRLVNNSNL